MLKVTILFGGLLGLSTLAGCGHDRDDHDRDDHRLSRERREQIDRDRLRAEGVYEPGERDRR